MKRLWVLGAADPEMEAIETLLRACGERVEHALVRGERVSPAEAYHARLSSSADLRDVAEVYLVECDLVGNEIAQIDSVHRIDHHRPGDPGYDRPPAEFLSASSIGQVIRVLALTTDALRRLNWEPCYHRQPYGWQSQAPQYEPHYGYNHTRGRLGWIGSPARWAVGYPASYTSAVYVPHDLVLVAAADHCLGAARRGECPGVDPDALI